MKKRVLSLTMAFLLAFTMLPTQAAAEELPEYEEVVEENASEEGPLEKMTFWRQSLWKAEAPAAEVENTERTVLTEETEETVTETEPAEEPTRRSNRGTDRRRKRRTGSERRSSGRAGRNRGSSNGRNPARRAAGKYTGDGSKWCCGAGRRW